MKRFLTATALTTVIATAGVAGTEGQEAKIKQYLPQTNIEMLSDAQMTQLITIANSGDSYSEKTEQMENIVMESNPVELELRNVQTTDLIYLAPSIDFTAFTAEELENAVIVVRDASSVDDARQRLRVIGVERTMVSSGILSEAEVNTIKTFDPEINLSELTDEEIVRIQAAIASGDRKSIDTAITSITDS